MIVREDRRGKETMPNIKHQLTERTHGLKPRPHFHSCCWMLSRVALADRTSPLAPAPRVHMQIVIHSPLLVFTPP